MEKEFVIYLKSKKVFHRFMELWKERYRTLGKAGGSIILNSADASEKEAIELLLGLHFNTTTIKITYSKMMKQLQQTKFQNIDFLKVLELYFEEPIITNKEIKEVKTLQYEEDSRELYLLYQNTVVMEWLLYCQKENNQLFNKIIHIYQIHQQQILYVMNAILALPLWKQEVKSFSIFSNEITKNPHYFDKGIANTLLFQAVTYFLGYQNQVFSLLDKNRAWLEVGLMKEEDLNYCMVYGLYGKTIDNKDHVGLRYFSNQKESLNLHVGNIQNIRELYPIDKVIVIENPSVFRYLISLVKSEGIDSYAFICTNGELNYAAYLLLDLVFKSHIEMLYCGDFDPEGVLIADKVKRRYGEYLHVWHYQESDYVMTHPTKVIEEYRLEKLKHCTQEELQIVKRQLLIHKKSGYQESLIDIYRSDILEMKL